MNTKCVCGSGLEHKPKYDGHGIFLTYVCNRCEAEKMSHYRSDIMDEYDCSEDIEPDDGEELFPYKGFDYEY